MKSLTGYTVGVISAVEREITPFLSVMTEIQTEQYAMIRFHKGKYAGVNVVALFCGVCKVNAAIAAQTLIDRYPIDQVIVTGTAGGIDQALQIGDTVLALEAAYHDVADQVLVEYHPYMQNSFFVADPILLEAISRANAGDHTVKIGRIVTGEAFIDQDGRKEIIERYHPLCVDMETASIAHVCYANKIPFAAIRSVSDTVNESGNGAFEKYCEMAAEKSVTVLRRYLETIH